MKRSRNSTIVILVSVLVMSCITNQAQYVDDNHCECDSIIDFSQPLNLSFDKDSNLVSPLRKSPFSHCLVLSNETIRINDALLNPLILNSDILIGYIRKSSTKYYYVDEKLKSEELLFDFNTVNKDSWLIKNGYFSNYQVSFENLTYKDDSIHTFIFEYIGITIPEGIYYKRIAMTKSKIKFIEFTSGVTCRF